jgi:hypothetical protein
VLLGFAGLAVAAMVARVILVMWPPLTWVYDYDRAAYDRIVEAIAADPQHLCGQRLYDVSRELGLKDVPWDDGNVQNLSGSLRIYHFRGFSLNLPLDYTSQGVTEEMLLARGESTEQPPARDLLRINRFQYPSVWVDGIGNREERMRQFRKRVEDNIREINEKMELEHRKRLDRKH